LPKCLKTEVKSPDDAIDVTALTDADGKILQLQVVNLEGRAMPTRIQLDGFSPSQTTARITEILGQLGDVNSPEGELKIRPIDTVWQHEISGGAATYTFPPYSFSIVRFN
jgi:alpha-L-arabinofuranosidase